MKVQSYKAGKTGHVEIDATAFGDKVMHRLLKEVVIMYQANKRLGTAKTKTRAEVHGSHAKPWKQKHTGRARAGDKKSPIWRKGGTVFGPVPHSFSFYMPAQAKRVALRSAIAGKMKENEFVVADMPQLDKPSAKSARKMLTDLGRLPEWKNRRTLLVLAKADANVWKSFRNFPGVEVRTADELNALHVLNGGLIVAEKVALDALQERVGKKGERGERTSMTRKSAAGSAASIPAKKGQAGDA
ncbi:MAG: 50S ribosomal protein L4 [Planctomycetota bacterium]|nr:50S ribosomal protein L4 [Planctomycetota bacterium]